MVASKERDLKAMHGMEDYLRDDRECYAGDVAQPGSLMLHWLH